MGSLHKLTLEHLAGLLQPAPVKFWARQSPKAEAIWLCLPARRGLARLSWRRLCPGCPGVQSPHFCLSTLQGAVLLEISEAPGAGTSGFEKGTNSRVQVLLNNEPLEGENAVS